jgi:hypothetical protein
VSIKSKNTENMKQIFASIILLITVSFNSIGQTTESIPSDSIVLYQYIGGIPNIFYVRAKERVLNSMGIGVETFFGDCGGTYNYKHEEFQKKNLPAIESLKSRLGDNWKAELDRLVSTEMS